MVCEKDSHGRSGVLDFHGNGTHPGHKTASNNRKFSRENKVNLLDGFHDIGS